MHQAQLAQLDALEQCCQSISYLGMNKGSTE